MGEAKQRGTFDERQATAKPKIPSNTLSISRKKLLAKNLANNDKFMEEVFKGKIPQNVEYIIGQLIDEVDFKNINVDEFLNDDIGDII